MKQTKQEQRGRVCMLTLVAQPGGALQVIECTCFVLVDADSLGQVHGAHDGSVNVPIGGTRFKQCKCTLHVRRNALTLGE